ncbi:MAG: hypothetical protein MJ195_02280 [Mycoplasmoidaceae bacterium]|nr:hypothetical protein [Mycoplasmoidaceae bacterium]
MGKIREGVTLRSLEQKSPLNIYVEEADQHFNTLKKNVAHKVVISIHRLYIPNIAGVINDRLHDSKLITDKHYEELKTKFSSEANKNIRINFADLINKRPSVNVAPANGSAKEQLIKTQNEDKPTIKVTDKEKPKDAPKIVEK